MCVYADGLLVYEDIFVFVGVYIWVWTHKNKLVWDTVIAYMSI